jgi:iron(III) transport system substrate-binding protein
VEGVDPLRNPRLKTALALAAAGALTLALAACGGAEPAGGASAPTSDKKVTVYSGRSESLVKPVLAEFTQTTGITVEARYGDTAQMAAQLLEEGDRTAADVFLAQDAGALGAVAKKGLFAPLANELLSRVPTQYRARSGQWVGVTGRARVLVYNPDLVAAADLPTSVFDVTEPRWRGKVGIAPTNGSFQAFITAIRVSQGDAKAKEFLTGLKANAAPIRPSNDQIVLDIADGKLPAGLVNHYYVHEIAKEKGVAPDSLKARLHFFAAGDVGNLVNVSGVGVLKGAADDPDARALVEYLLGKQAQSHFASEVWEYPLIEGVAPASGLPHFVELQPPAIDLNDLDSLEQTIAIIKQAGLA